MRRFHRQKVRFVLAFVVSGSCDAGCAGRARIGRAPFLNLCENSLVGSGVSSPETAFRSEPVVPQFPDAAGLVASLPNEEEFQSGGSSPSTLRTK